MAISTIDQTGLQNPLSLASPTISSGSILNSNGRPMTAQTGGILQVVQAVLTTSLTIDSQTPVTFLTANITPYSSSSKILLTMHVTGNCLNNGSGFLYMYRSGTQIAMGTDANSNTKVTAKLDYYGIPADSSGTASMMWLDSPSTTSSISYTVAGSRGSDPSGKLYINRTINYPSSTEYDANSISTLTLMEIAG